MLSRVSRRKKDLACFKKPTALDTLEERALMGISNLKHCQFAKKTYLVVSGTSNS